MKSRTILMSAPMVLATLGDLKTQTRRVVKPQPRPGPVPGMVACYEGDLVWRRSHHSFTISSKPNGPDDIAEDCPYGVPGDELWVKETAYITPLDFGVPWDCNCVDDQGRPRLVGYAASMDFDSVRCATEYGVKKSPSIHMPRWASRLTLRVLSVRVERLQDISEEDAITEGIRAFTKDGALMKYAPAYRHVSGELEAAPGWTWQEMPRSAIDAYARLWDQINGVGSWAENRWVWVVEFERVKGVG